MKNLKDILQGIAPIRVDGSIDRKVKALQFDSRLVYDETVFIAVKGVATDGHDFIENAIEKGCRVIVAEKKVPVPDNITFIEVADSTIALAKMASNFYENPSEKLKLVGVTGTNGKTTTTTLLYNLFSQLGYPCGLISTVVNRIGLIEIPATHTTPDPIQLNTLLAEMVKAGCSHCFMEVSSHAIHQKRIAGLTFTGAVFTNITHDHLDYHKTFAEYIRVKKSYFNELSPEAFALSNADDKNGNIMLQNTKAKKYTFALKTPADFKAKVIENQFSGLVLSLNGIELWTRLIGDFNAYNLLAVFAVSRLLGENETEVLTILSQLKSVDGRFQHLHSQGGIAAIIDYAHTPDALENVLKTISNIRTKNETVITVIGCGGDRDRAKRPQMAAIACELSDKVILTSDNPRSEEPTAILSEMESGVPGQHFKKVLTVVDRAQAIKTAISMAQKGDILLIAGKGHEKYQEIKGVKYPFDDLELTRDLFEKLEK
jgi:UDP-N-acetylmuramoyl-L-alanyl-D-glutamate--2,6-diaminopimelate ligase